MANPRVSVITAVYAPPREAFEETVASVLAQTFADWEWVLTDDCSPADWVRPRLEELARQDSRITVRLRAENGGIVAASNESLAAARGEFVALLDHDDVLEPHALECMLAAADETDEPDEPAGDERIPVPYETPRRKVPEEVDYVYSDQDRMTVDGRLNRPFRKPDWSPERLRHHMYTTHFSMLRRSLVDEVGGFRAGYDGSQDHDLVLRVSERARRVVHVPEILYHWREVPGSAAADPFAKPYAWEAGVRAIQDHLDRLGIEAAVTTGVAPGFYTVERAPDLTTSVSVIIPTMGSRAMVWGRTRTLVVEAVRSVLAKSRRDDIEFVVVYDSVTSPALLAELREIPGARLRLVEFTEPFNFSAKVNVGALHASGDVLVFLNDDMEAESDGLIETLIAPLAESSVGATGALLLFEDGRIQHAGVTYGSGEIGHHYYKSNKKRGHYGELRMNREVSAVTGACLAVRREVFEEVGGFTERLPGNFNDVDFCLKVRDRGYRIVWMHEVVLHHFESISREASIKPFELNHMNRRWGNHKVVREGYTSA